MQDSEVSDGGEEEITTSQSSASMQVFAAVRDAFRIKNGIKWEKFPRGQPPPSPSMGTPKSQKKFKAYFAF